MTIHRTTSRVLPVSPDGAVLLLQERDPADGARYWASIGGSADPGESALSAALRELREETGIVADPGSLVGPVFRHQNTYSWNGVEYAGDHTYFALALDRDVSISFDALEPEEVGNVLEAAWWSPADLGTTAFRPPDLLLDIMTSAITAVRGQQ